MAIKGVKKSLVLFSTLLLSACGQMFIKSTVVFEHTNFDYSLASDIERMVIARVEGNGGTCKPHDDEHRFISCFTSKKMIIYAGFDRDEFVFIEFESSVVGGPTTSARIESGYFIPDEQRRWETWVNTEFGDYTFVEKRRRTTGSPPIIQDF